MAFIVSGKWVAAGKTLGLVCTLFLVAGCAHEMAVTGQKQTEVAADLLPLAALAPGVREDVRYVGPHNFMGRPVAGYEGAQCWLSRPAAQSLAAVQKELLASGMALKVYDCYRPQTAVDDFVRWGKDLADQKNRDMYYPRVPKAELFKRGYIAEKSGHSRGSTADLTVVVVDAKRASKLVRGPLADGIDVDMGTPFDLFDEQSHTDNAEQSPDVQHNRRWLRSLMQGHGWRNLPEEWWHYTLINEPYPHRYFDIPVRKVEQSANR